MSIPHDQLVRAGQLRSLPGHIRSHLLKIKPTGESMPEGVAIEVRSLDSKACLPTRNNPHDAGYDLYSIEDFTIPGGDRGCVKTGISIDIPPGYVGLIWPRSGLSFNSGIDVLAGVIDAGYQGEIGVILQNHGIDFRVTSGLKVAQIIIHKIPEVAMVWAEGKQEETDRGTDGWGSSDST